MGLMLETVADRLARPRRRTSTRRTRGRRGACGRSRWPASSASPSRPASSSASARRGRSAWTRWSRSATSTSATGTSRRSSSRTSAPSRASRWRDAPEPSLDDLRRTLAVARLLLGPDVNIQAPPNLSPAPTRRCSRRGSTTGAASRRSPSTTSTPRRPGRARRAARATERQGFASASAWPSIPSTRRAGFPRGARAPARLGGRGRAGRPRDGLT